MFQIQKIEKGTTHLTVIRELFTAYATELGEDLTFQNFEEELKDPFKKYGPPRGSLFIGNENEKAVGCIALQPLSKTTCEMKRLYVLPSYRKSGLGKILVDALIEDAIQKEYKVMVLDTLQKLQPAIELYRQLGFKETTAYYANPLPGVVYMEKELIR